MQFTIEIRGVEELSATLDSLPRKLQGKAIQGALKAGGNIIRTAYRGKIPIRQDTGSASAKRISKRSSAYRLPGFARASVIVAKSRIAEDTVEVGASRRAFYLSILEFGSRYISPRGWLRSAFETSAAPAIAKIGGMLWIQIERIAAKMGATSGE